MQARRRPLAAVLAGVAVLAGLRTLAPPPVPTVEVLVAAHDLAAGSVVGSDDVLPAAYSPASRPTGSPTTRSAGCWPRRCARASP